MAAKNPVVPLILSFRGEAVESNETGVAEVCDLLLEDAAEEVSDHRSLREFYMVPGFITLASTGLLGRAVLLLYCDNLFACPEQRRECVTSYSTRKTVVSGDLDLLGIAAARVRSLDLAPLSDKAIIDILRRVCTTTYFLKEDRANASRVIRKFELLETTPSKKTTLWYRLDVKLRGAYNRARYVHYHPRHAGKLDFDNQEPVKYCLSLEPTELLRCLKNNEALSMLITKKPPQSFLPHGEAAAMCIEYAVVWLNAPHLSIFQPLKLTYGDLSTGNPSEYMASFIKHWDVSIPSKLDRTLRCNVFNAHLSHCIKAGEDKADEFNPRPKPTRKRSSKSCLRQDPSKIRQTSDHVLLSA